MSAELDLLDGLTGWHMSLSEVLLIFDGVQHARDTLVHYLNDGVIEIYDMLDIELTALPISRLKALFWVDASWQEDSTLRVRLTEAGYKQYWRDSSAFFDRLVGHE